MDRLLSESSVTLVDPQSSSNRCLPPTIAMHSPSSKIYGLSAMVPWLWYFGSIWFHVPCGNWKELDEPVGFLS